MTSEKVKGILISAIRRMAQQGGISPIDVQLSFGLTDQNHLHCLLYAKGQPQPATLSQLIGNNIYNIAVRSHIEKRIVRLATDAGKNPHDTSLRAQIGQDHEVQVQLYAAGRAVREVSEAELKT